MSAAITPPALDSLLAIRDRLRTFADERDWNQFHAPKNLAMALIVEAAEVVEHFQWQEPFRDPELPSDKRAAIGAELADVLFYLVRLADRLDIDLGAAAADKLAANAARYPAERVRGSARKYDEYDR
ncbi:MAG: nucleotide pyrophosphohydrolase [Betaproteobacteria bacterium]|nr:nucleotide pyrophosphohydrolase [Betaproteobacteria bacterium]